MFKDYTPDMCTKSSKFMKPTKNYVILEEFMKLDKDVMTYYPETTLNNPYFWSRSMNMSAQRFGFPVKVVVRHRHPIFIRIDRKIMYPELL